MGYRHTLITASFVNCAICTHCQVTAPKSNAKSF